MTALTSRIEGLPVVVANRRGSDVHRVLSEHRSYQRRTPGIDGNSEEINITDGMFSSGDIARLVAFAARPSLLLVTTSLKDGLDTSIPILRALLLERQQREGSSEATVFIVPCENVLTAQFVSFSAVAQSLGATYVPCVVDRLCSQPYVDPATHEVCVETEEYASWVLQRSDQTGPLEALLQPLVASGVAQFVGDIEAFRRRKLWLVNGVHAACALLALHANELALEAFLKTEGGEFVLRETQGELGHAFLEASKADETDELQDEDLATFSSKIRERFMSTPDSPLRVLSRFAEHQLPAFFRNVGPKLVEPAFRLIREEPNRPPPMLSYAVWACLALASEGRFVDSPATVRAGSPEV